MAADPSGLFEELRRRKVFRATAAYVVVAAGVGAVASDFFPALGLPDWTVTLVVALLILGLPVTIALSWAFDVRPSEPGQGVEAGEDALPGASGRRTTAGRFRWTAGRIAVVGAVIILGLAGGAMLFTGGETSAVVGYRVAVLPFENQTGEADLDPLGLMASEWISDGLAAIDSAQVVPAIEVREILAGPSQANQLRRIALETLAGTAVTGSYVLVGDSIEVRGQIVDPEEGAILLSLDPALAPRANPTAALVPIRQQAMTAIARRLDTRIAEAIGREIRPPLYEAFEAYLFGMELFSSFRYDEAFRQFDRSHQIDSTFWAPMNWVASGYGNLGQFARMDSVVRLLDAHRAELSEGFRLKLDEQRARVRGDLHAAYRFARRIFERGPGQLTRYINALYAYDTNRPRTAADLLQQERRDAEIRSAWLGFHSVLTASLHLLGDYQRELEAARRARERFADHPSPVGMEAQALAGMGRTEEAAALVDEVRLLASSPRSAVIYIRRIGDALAAHGHHDAAARLYDRALATWPSGEPADAYEHRLYADLLRRAGRLKEAAAQVETARELDPDDRDAQALEGIIAAQRGDRARADRIAEELAARTDPYAHGGNTYNRACIRARLGDLDRAVELLRQAHAEGQPLALWFRHDPDLRPLDGYAPFEELIRPKG